MARLRRALCLALSLGVAACATSPLVAPPEVSLAGLTLGRTGRLEQQLWVDLRLGNPNPFELRVAHLQFALEADRQRLGEGRLRRGIALPARGEVVVPVLMRTASAGLVAAMMDISGEQQLAYRLVGEAALDGVAPQSVAFRRDGSLELPRRAKAEAGGS
ncbi:MAG TPA: LEA type 2 family protein [Geminicoccaceae bacterium]|nr:LEA type 2 family protein [Geminicoccaceae bacterium]